MRKVSEGVLILGLLLVAVEATAQCAKDTDCKGSRVCDHGRCVEAAPAAPPVAATPEPPLPMPVALPPAYDPPAVYAYPPPPSPPPRAPRNVISTNPLDILGGSIGVQYELVLARWFSLAVGISFYDSDMDPINSSSGTVLGGGVTVQPRFYLLRRGAPRGLYLSPVVSAFYLTDTYAASGVGYSVGGLIGWSWVIGRSANIKLGVGVQYIDMRVTDDYGDSYGASGVAPLGELTFGWAF
jgi:hypothetical protein